MYVCRKCIDKKFQCPHCKKKIPSKLLVAAMAPAAIVFITTIVMLAFFLPENIEEYNWNEMELTDISDLEVGDEVKIVGYINSTDPEPISGYDKKTDEGRKFKNTAVDFYVYDVTGQVYINMSDWKSIYRGRHPANLSNVGGTAYYNGDLICVIGDTELNETGELILRGEIIGRNSEAFFDFNDISFFIYFSGIPGIVLLLGATIFVYRWSYHNRNKQSVQITPYEDMMEHEPEFVSIEWYLNSTYNKFRLIAASISIVALIVTLVIFYFGLIPLEFSSACCDSGVLLVFIYMWPPMFIWIYLDIPVKVGISQEGLHVRFRTKQFDQSGSTFFKWSEIQEISLDIGMDTSLVFTMKDGNKNGIASLSNEIGQIILDYYRCLRQETPKKIKPKVHEKIKWFNNQYTKKHMFYSKISLILSILLAPIVIMICISYNFSFEATLYSFVFLITPLISYGLIVTFLYRTETEQIGFSKKGIHLKYYKKSEPSKPEYLSWQEIDQINPPANLLITIFRKNGIEQDFRFINIELIQKIIQNFEKYKIRINKYKPQILPRVGIEINWIENEYFKKLKKKIYFPICIVTIISLILLISSLALHLVAIIVAPLWIFLPVILESKFYEYSMGPQKVGFSKYGIHTKYRKKKLKPFLLKYINWGDISKLKDIDAFKWLSSTDFTDTEFKNYFLVEKVTGTNSVLGPISPQIADEIKGRVDKNVIEE
jgi:hypothetical protein